ncbi:MAG: adenosylcobinamide-GDP ribazoletransferase [Candidatus Syntrophonatronum acetioxidans]|uniref:Adenosylcobinamide-GDP ribazoletransferase n=1 Tax=Candidatus Syntrophonatronum acetioxidans TaxID=1795816 RepID=A0A424YJD7_9FIRM|nr:MAG: adenosylcobinamide-GDP ribazoletransferase [Candidatus Syntrophonatronum acetioxidans]
MKGFLIALQFLTRIPVKIEGSIEEGDLINSLYYYPLIGFIIGILLVLVNSLLVSYLPLGARSVVLLTIIVFVSGGLHLDGFMDTMDGICSGKDRERSLEIMRDSRVGAFGVLGLVLILLLKLTFLQNISGQALNSALLVMPVASRWTVVVNMTMASYARQDFGLGKVMIDNAGWKEVLVTMIFTLIISVYLLGFQALSLLLLLLIFTWFWSVFLKGKIGGLTGDTLGALLEMSEVLVLFILLI